MGGFVFAIYPWMRSLGERTLGYALLTFLSGWQFGCCQSFLYLIYVDGVNPVEYLKLKQNWKRGVILGIVLSAINLFGSMIRFGVPHPSAQSLTWNSVIGTSILIGFIEEIPYRGFMLQKFSERYGFRVATPGSSILFLDYSPSRMDLASLAQSQQRCFRICFWPRDGLCVALRKVALGADYYAQHK